VFQLNFLTSLVLVSRSENKFLVNCQIIVCMLIRLVGFGSYNLTCSGAAVSDLLTKKPGIFNLELGSWSSQVMRCGRCLRKGLLGTREARHQEMPKINGYLIPHVTHSCTLFFGKKAGLSLSEHGKSKLGFIAANLAMV